MIFKLLRLIYRYFRYEQHDEFVSAAWIKEHKRNN